MPADIPHHTWFPQQKHGFFESNFAYIYNSIKKSNTLSVCGLTSAWRNTSLTLSKLQLSLNICLLFPLCKSSGIRPEFFFLLCVKPATHLAILYADRRDRRKSPGVPGAAIAIFADRRDRRIIADIWHVRYRRLNSPAFAKCARSRDFLRLLLWIASKANPSGWAILSHEFSKLLHRRDRRKKSPGVSASISGENRLRFSLAIKFAAIGV